MRKRLFFLVLAVALAVAGLSGPLVPAAQATSSGCYTICSDACGSPCCTICCPTSTGGVVCHHPACAC